MRQLKSMPWREVLMDRHLQISDEIVEACRSVSLRLGGPRLASVGVTSVIHGEGRSTIAIALALIQAMDYRRQVILLEMDGEQPSLAGRLSGVSHPGLSELAHGMHSLEEVLQQAAPRLSVVTVGAALPDSEAMVLDRLGSGLFQQIQARADVVVADLPPVLTTSYGARAAGLFEQVLLVVLAGVTPQPQMREAIESLPAKTAILLNDVHSRIPRWLRAIIGA